MTNKNEEKAPPPSVGFTYNLMRSKSEQESEFDSIETINAIKNSLLSGGYAVTLLEANDSLPSALENNHFDIIFNIAEGVNGRSREAQVPALLDFFNLKFTGSDATTLCVCLDKALTKHILVSHKIKTPAFQLIDSPDFILNPKLIFPLIVKPNAEGSSKGITGTSVANNKTELKKIVNNLFKSYNQPLLIEEFIPGREFTVGIIGNGNDVQVLPPMEVIFLNDEEYNFNHYSIKHDFENKIEYQCPANVSHIINLLIMDTAKKIYNVLGCKDFARIDFRLSPYNELNFLEINPLPGLTPGYSDMPMIAEKNGISYESLINMILSAAIKRYSDSSISWFHMNYNANYLSFNVH